MAAIAVYMMAGTAFATESVVMVNNNVVTVQSDNIFDKMIAMVRGYIKKIDAAKTHEELQQVVDQCYKELMEYPEKYMDEFLVFEWTLTEEKQAAYEKQIDAVLAEFGAAVERKTKEFQENYDLDL